MAWHQISTNFDHLNALNLIKLRCDSGISLDENENVTSRTNNERLKTTPVPKYEPQEQTSNVNYQHDVLPNFEDHDNGGYNFKLSIRPQNEKHSQWLYSQPLNKLFIRLNKLLNIDICYTLKVPGERLRVRAFMCFLKEVSEPVRRCANHLSRDFESYHPVERDNVLRCENPSAVYCGTAEGKNIRDRFSVLIPLHTSNVTQEETLKETLAFKFVCQNSCIGRKQTSLMILLENMNGVVLAQRWFYVRICSCPKRDKSFEERHALLQCVAQTTDTEESLTTKSTVDKNIRVLEETILKKTSPSKDYDLQLTSNGGVRIAFEVTSKDIALAAIQYAFSRECANVVNQGKDAKRSARYVRKLKRLYDEGKKL